MLAQVTGFYRELPVSRALQDHFACTWVHQLPVDGTSPIVIVPDGSIDLQWVAGGWRIAGPDREPQAETPLAGAIIIGFRFRPAAAAAWLGMPATEILNQRVPLDDIWGAKAHRMAEGASCARARGADGCARNAVARAPPADRRSDMHAAFDLLSAGAPPEKSPVPWLGKELAFERAHLAPALRPGLRLRTEDA